jgi:hypothetical protein
MPNQHAPLDWYLVLILAPSRRRLTCEVEVEGIHVRPAVDNDDAGSELLRGTYSTAYGSRPVETLLTEGVNQRGG